ncbi:MAG: hypothetical protein AAFX01_07915 [Cyanobacteria bacterium J06638_28]
MDPVIWLGISLVLVCISLMLVLALLLVATRELGRAARSVEKLCDTLQRELPPTLESIRRTGLEITELTDDVTEGVQQAGRVAQQVNQGVTQVRQQAKRAQVKTRSLMAGARAAWHTLTRPNSRDRRRLPKSQNYVPPALPSGQQPEIPLTPETKQLPSPERQTSSSSQRSVSQASEGSDRHSNPSSSRSSMPSDPQTQATD